MQAEELGASTRLCQDKRTGVGLAAVGPDEELGLIGGTDDSEFGTETGG